MFFLVTGASGVGKSTVRKLIGPEFADALEVAELSMLGSTPKWYIQWRHRMVERTVLRALDAQREGKHFLLCGDPVPPGEVWAAPSADRLERLDVCLLDAGEKAQTARLLERGDDSNLIRHHVAFADWMRHHVVDHRHRPEIITRNAWSQNIWDRWVGITAIQPPWSSHIIDTSELCRTAVAHLVAQWLRQHIHASKTDAPNSGDNASISIRNPLAPNR